MAAVVTIEPALGHLKLQHTGMVAAGFVGLMAVTEPRIQAVVAVVFVTLAQQVLVVAGFSSLPIREALLWQQAALLILHPVPVTFCTFLIPLALLFFKSNCGRSTAPTSCGTSPRARI